MTIVTPGNAIVNGGLYNKSSNIGKLKQTVKKVVTVFFETVHACVLTVLTTLTGSQRLAESMIDGAAAGIISVIITRGLKLPVEEVMMLFVSRQIYLEIFKSSPAEFNCPHHHLSGV